MIRPAVVAISLLALPAFAQQVISVRSGLIHYAEGDILINGERRTIETSRFPMIQDGQTLATASGGRVEVLLTPGVFMRLSENSSMKMLTSSLSDAKVELLSGAALIEVAELHKEHRVTVKLRDSQTLVLKSGLYLFDATLNSLRVFDGKAQMAVRDGMLTLGKGREATLGSEQITAVKFNRKKTDGLYEWSLVRSNTLATATISAAGDLRRTGYQGYMGGWAWCPNLGLFTFLPYSGYIRSPFGWHYYSPGGLWRYYADQDARRQASQGYGGGRADSPWGGFGDGGFRGAGAGRGASSSSSPAVFSSGGGGEVRASAPAAAPAQESPGGARGR